MTALLAHRGPDGEGFWLCPEDGIGLGNRRLAIIERGSSGAQPMGSPDGSIQLTFNGEIFNHAVLRAELEVRGHTLRSRADTETIIHAYEEWGVDCFARFSGMWALALWDSGRKRLVLSRDRLGIKPLYYLEHERQIRFASEIKALFASPGPRPKLDLESLTLRLTYLATPGPRTLFKGVRKLLPGHLLICQPDREPELVSYWQPLESTSPRLEQAASLSPDQLEQFAVESIRERLSAAVKQQVRADVPVGVFLSGGIDSSTVACLMRAHVTGRLSAFSVGYDEPSYPNELAKSRQIAQLYDLEHHEVILTEQDVIDSFDDLLYHLDEPNADPVNFAIYDLAREARQSGTIVILSGEGSDEIFGGYGGYLRAIQMAKFANGLLRRLPAARRALALLSPLFDLAERTTGRGRGLRDDLERFCRGEPSFIGLQVGLPERVRRSVLGTAVQPGSIESQRPATAAARYIAEALGRRPLDGRSEFRPHSTLDQAWGGVECDSTFDAFRWISYLELKQRLPDFLLDRLDKLTMAHAVEARPPFLEHELVEFVMAMPGSLRLRGGVLKYLLKRAVEPWLPPEIVHQPKLPFGAPIARWLRGRLGHHVEQQVMQSQMVQEGILNGERIRALIEAHRSGRVDNSQAIWSLHSLSRWHDLFLTSVNSSGPSRAVKQRPASTGTP